MSSQRSSSRSTARTPRTGARRAAARAEPAEVIDVVAREVPAGPHREPPRAAPETAIGAAAAAEGSGAVRAPGPLLLALEGRAPWEFAASLVAAPWLRRLPRGDGHTVLVFPGLAANDLTTLPMRAFLRDRGYEAQPWQQGLNLGPRAGVLEAARERVRALAAASGRPISLLGWSLGGVYARELAKEAPELVRCVITLGSPFAGPVQQATNAWWLFERVSGPPDAAMMASLAEPPPVPTTSIYSRTDGIVAWQCSVNPPAPRAENVEVHASHIGLGLNPLAMVAIADRLAQDPARWTPFDASGPRRWFFRSGAAGA
jgi:pimeloyl-ACP methyl ester carboxylesterase